MSLLLDRKTIEELLTMEEALDLIGRAFAELARGTVLMPQRLAMTMPQVNGWSAFMPAYVSQMGALGVKAVTVFRDNPTAHRLPSTMATIVLLDSATGRPLSIMDGGYITAMRTGAVTGVATRYLARHDARVAGVLGTGVQARTQVLAMCTVRAIERVVCYSVDEEGRQAFVQDMAARLGIPVELALGPRQVVEAADVLCLATTAHEPIMDAGWLQPGTHINSVGSHTPEARELDTVTIQRAKVVCDSTDACLAEAGDLLIPIQEGEFSADRIYGDLGELVTGRKPGRGGAEEVTLFKSVGLSIQDISTALFVYNRAVERGVGVPFEF